MLVCVGVYGWEASGGVLLENRKKWCILPTKANKEVAICEPPLGVPGEWPEVKGTVLVSVPGHVLAGVTRGSQWLWELSASSPAVL